MFTELILTDAILVDLGPTDPCLAFVEVDASADRISDSYQSATLPIAMEAKYRENQLAFVTIYADLEDIAFKRTASKLA